ncbi:hypothetical protein KY320_03880 [Candidatus Woesearchaeota archaeon]|nr:hypothetical protein [Candidatus Woesearchaeota archaeon]
MQSRFHGKRGITIVDEEVFVGIFKDAYASYSLHRENVGYSTSNLAYTLRTLGLADNLYELGARRGAPLVSKPYDYRTLESITVECTLDGETPLRARDEMPTQDIVEYSTLIQELTDINPLSLAVDKCSWGTQRQKILAPKTMMRTFSGGILWCFTHKGELYFMLLEKDEVAPDFKFHAAPCLGYPIDLARGKQQGFPSEFFYPERTCWREGLEEILVVQKFGNEEHVLVPYANNLHPSIDCSKSVKETADRLGFKFAENQYIKHHVEMLKGDDTLKIRGKREGVEFDHAVGGFLSWFPPCSADLLLIGYLGDIEPETMLVFDGEGYDRNAIIVNSEVLLSAPFLGKQTQKPINFELHTTLDGKRLKQQVTKHLILLPQVYRVLNALGVVGTKPYFQELAWHLAHDSVLPISQYIPLETIYNRTNNARTLESIAGWGPTITEFQRAMDNGASY